MRSSSGFLCVFLVLSCAMTGRAADRNEKLLDHFQALATADEASATRAILALASKPKEVVGLLDQRLEPVKVDATRISPNGSSNSATMGSPCRRKPPANWPILANSFVRNWKRH